MSDPVPARFDQRHAERVIHDRARDTANIQLTDHARDRMAERGIAMRELLTILRTGHVFGTPARNDRGEWEASIEMRLPGGRDAAAVTVIPAGVRLIIKTVMWRDLR